MPQTNCSPIIKWVGGKRQLLSEIKARMPKEYGTYYEPFFGGGALFFELQPEKAVINDFNDQLINLYQQIKDDCQSVIAIIDQYQNAYNAFENDSEKLDYFYSLRKQFNSFLKSNTKNPESAALFIFLNKAGFNGLYRVNANGEFNVPSAHRDKINSYQLENIQAASAALRKATILQGDFEAACKNAQPGDFVFFDSPYYDTFDTYQAGGFDEAAHRRLAALFKELSDRDVKCMMTNSNTDFIKELYSEFNIEIVNVKRMVNCDASKRTGQEVIVTNYKGGE
jgi:DNA adenine methylase